MGHRYWAVAWITAGNAQAPTLASLVMRTVSGGANVCAGGTPIARSAYAGAMYVPANAFDGDAATYWFSDGPAGVGAVWLGYDFGAGNAKEIVEVVLTSHNGSYANNAPTAFAVRASDDGVRWFDVWQVSGLAAWTASLTRTFTKPTDLRALFELAHRYWRIFAIRAQGSGSYRAIADLELRATVGGADQTVPGGTCSSSPAASVPAANAFDASLATYWESSGPAYLRYDFGAGNEKVVREIAIKAMTDATWYTETPREFHIQFSDDDVTWITAATHNDAIFTSGQQRVFDAAIPVSIVPPSTLGEILPNTGPTPGGTAVTITGSGLTGTTGVTFGGIAATNVAVVNPTSITCNVPAHALGSVDVVATGPYGTVTLAAGFTYQIGLTSLAPVGGPETGNTLVTLTGVGFTGTVPSVQFGGIAATNVIVVNDTTITCNTSLHAPATVDVTVTVAGVTKTLVAAFTYEVAWGLTGIDPAAGYDVGGNSVTITGVSLSGVPTVSFGGTPAANVQLVNPTTITCDTPAHAPGLVDVSVTIGFQTKVLIGAYTYSIPAPTILGVDPVDGFDVGGRNVTITGSRFLGATAVRFGGILATNLAVVDDETITCTTPAHDAGVVPVQVTTGAGTGTLPDGFTYILSLQLDTIVPNVSGVIGTQVVISGQAFVEPVSVEFGGVSALDIVVVDETTITCTVPAHVAGVVHVVVLSSGQVATKNNGFTYIAPTISGLLPNNGPTLGGTLVILNGAHLTGTDAIEVDGEPATDIQVLNDSLVSFVTPPAITGGVVDVTLHIGALATVTFYTSFRYSTTEYTIHLQHIDGTVENIPVYPSSSSKRHVLLGRAPKLPLVVDSNMFARATFVIFKNDNPREQAFLMIEREPRGNFTSIVKAVNYDDRYYSHDRDFIDGLIDEDGYPI